MANNKVMLSNGTVIMDVTDTTATASDVASGKYFYTANGVKTLGTASGGGGSSWTKIAETTYQVNTSSTSAATVATWATGHSELWTGDSYVFIRIRDTAGKRAGYYWGSDCLFVNFYAANGSTTGTLQNVIGRTYGVTTAGRYNTTRHIYDDSGYGIFPDQLYSDGRIRIRERYSSTYTGTINGTYKVEVYLLDPSTGSPIFA